MAQLNDDIRKNLGLTFTILSILILYIIYEIYKPSQDINLTHDTEIVCGFFIRTTKEYRNRGMRDYFAEIKTEKFGIVSLSINSNLKDNITNTDFKTLTPNAKICLNVLKPKSNNWFHRNFIFQILKN